MITFNEWLEKIDEVVSIRPKVLHTRDYASGEIKYLIQSYMANERGGTLTPEKLAELKQQLQSWSDVAKDLPVYKQLEAKLMAAKPVVAKQEKGMQLHNLSGTDASDFINARSVRKPKVKKPQKQGWLSWLTGRQSA
jgi:hypothetical protein